MNSKSCEFWDEYMMKNTGVKHEEMRENEIFNVHVAIKALKP